MRNAWAANIKDQVPDPVTRRTRGPSAKSRRRLHLHQCLRRRLGSANSIGVYVSSSPGNDVQTAPVMPSAHWSRIEVRRLDAPQAVQRPWHLRSARCPCSVRRPMRQKMRRNFASRFFFWQIPETQVGRGHAVFIKNTSATSYAREAVRCDWRVAGLQNLKVEQVLDLAGFLGVG